MFESMKFMGKTTIVSMIFNFVRWYVGTGVFNRINQLVLEMTDSDRSSDDKRKYVIESAKAEYDTVRTHVVDLAISTILTSMR